MFNEMEEVIYDVYFLGAIVANRSCHIEGAMADKAAYLLFPV